ncbi:hypothetical protein [Microbacterium sp. NPDC087592]|uniref:hypothetical protein n=1 Tax=Microbacterium sp. NPDC087592 TaxID=3364193 RepID=UPI0037F9C042
MTNRTVHGVSANGHDIVRYDRAGKWYLEPRNAFRSKLTVAQAAGHAALGVHRAGLPGGQAFDAIVARLKSDGNRNG